MTTTISYRIATAAMTAFVVMSLWTQTVTVPADAPAMPAFEQSLRA
jgi:hypothetical protein